MSVSEKPKFQFNLPDGAGFVEILERLCQSGTDVTVRVGGEQVTGRIAAIGHDYLMLQPPTAVTGSGKEQVLVYDPDAGEVLPTMEMIPLENIVSVSWRLAGPKPVYFAVPPSDR